MEPLPIQNISMPPVTMALPGVTIEEMVSNIDPNPEITQKNWENKNAPTHPDDWPWEATDEEWDQYEQDLEDYYDKLDEQGPRASYRLNDKL